MSDKYAFIAKALNERKQDHRFRSLSSVTPVEDSPKVDIDGQTYINFSSNDYLGFASHPQVIKQSQKYLQKYGTGSKASRLITGTLDIHAQFEQQIADTFNKEAALIFNSGFQANSSILGTVTDRNSLILADQLSHNSLLQGSLASRADLQRFEHNDMQDLERLLKRAQNKEYNRIWIVTETVFSMDGDRSPIDKIASLAAAYNAFLFVDDAHAVGIWGQDGLGLAKNIPQVDILLGTCGKAFGSFGAYVACSQKMKEYLVNFCPGFIYTTALPPAVIGATEAALNLIPVMNGEREAYHRRIKRFRNSVQQLGFDTGSSSTQIVPVIVGEEQKTLGLTKYLRKLGIWVTAIRPPTVPKSSSRIRITLSLDHKAQHLQKVIKALESWRHEQ